MEIEGLYRVVVKEKDYLRMEIKGYTEWWLRRRIT